MHDPENGDMVFGIQGIRRGGGPSYRKYLHLRFISVLERLICAGHLPRPIFWDVVWVSSSSTALIFRTFEQYCGPLNKATQYRFIFCVPKAIGE